MAGALSRRRRNEEPPYWPGFVDAMAQLLLVIIFLLSVFMVAQFLMAREIVRAGFSTRATASQIAELTELLALEKSAKAEVEGQLLSLTDDLNAAKAKNADLMAGLEAENARGLAAGSALSWFAIIVG